MKKDNRVKNDERSIWTILLMSMFIFFLFFNVCLPSFAATCPGDCINLSFDENDGTDNQTFWLNSLEDKCFRFTVPNTGTIDLWIEITGSDLGWKIWRVDGSTCSAVATSVCNESDGTCHTIDYAVSAGDYIVDVVGDSGTWYYELDVDYEIDCQDPSKPIEPLPSSGSTNMPIDQFMSWSNAGGATSYDVYFGTYSNTDASELKVNQTSTSYNPGNLNYETTYYWRVDAKNSCGTTTGDVWNFTTQSDPTSPEPNVDVDESTDTYLRQGATQKAIFTLENTGDRNTDVGYLTITASSDIEIISIKNTQDPNNPISINPNVKTTFTSAGITYKNYPAGSTDVCGLDHCNYTTDYQFVDISAPYNIDQSRSFEVVFRGVSNAAGNHWVYYSSAMEKDSGIYVRDPVTGMQDGRGIHVYQLDVLVPNVTLSFDRLTDTSNANHTAFKAGQTARIWLKATNSGTEVPVQVTLNIFDANGIKVFDSHVLGTDSTENSPLNGNNSAEYYHFDWIIPGDAQPGLYDIIGAIRDSSYSTDDPRVMVFDTTAPGCCDEDFTPVVSGAIEILDQSPIAVMKSLFGEPRQIDVDSEHYTLFGEPFRLVGFSKDPNFSGWDDLFLIPFYGTSSDINDLDSDQFISDPNMARAVLAKAAQYQADSLSIENSIEQIEWAADEYDLDKWSAASLPGSIFSKRKTDRAILGSLSFSWAKTFGNAYIKAWITGDVSSFLGALPGFIQDAYNAGRFSSVLPQEYAAIIMTLGYLDADLQSLNQMIISENLPDLDKILKLGEISKDGGKAIYNALKPELSELWNGSLDPDEYYNLVNEGMDSVNGFIVNIGTDIVYDASLSYLGKIAGFSGLDDEVKIFANLSDVHADAIHLIADHLLDMAEEINTLDTEGNKSSQNAIKLHDLYYEFSWAYRSYFWPLMTEITKVQLAHIKKIKDNTNSAVFWWTTGGVDVDEIANNHDNRVGFLQDANRQSRNYQKKLQSWIVLHQAILDNISKNQGNHLLGIAPTPSQSLIVGENGNLELLITNNYDYQIENLTIEAGTGDGGISYSIASLSALNPNADTTMSIQVSVPSSWFIFSDYKSMPVTLDLACSWNVNGVSLSKTFPIQINVTSKHNFQSVVPNKGFFLEGEPVQISVTTSDSLESSPDWTLIGYWLQPDGQKVGWGYAVGHQTKATLNLTAPSGPFGAYGLQLFAADSSSNGLISKTVVSKVFYVIPDATQDISLLEYNDLAIVYPRRDIEVATGIQNMLQLGSDVVFKAENYSLNELDSIASTHDVILIGGPIANPLVNILVQGNQLQCPLAQEGDALIKGVENAFGNHNAIVVAGYSLRDTSITGAGFAAQWLKQKPIPGTYPVSYNANGATSGSVPALQTKIHDVALTLSGNTGNLARTGYTFAGWNTSANGTGTGYAAGGAYTANAAVALYANWSMTETVATPTLSPAPGTYTSAQSVTIACATSGATIRYTTNNSEPTENSLVYSSPIAVDTTTTIKAKAFSVGSNPSITIVGNYIINTDSDGDGILNDGDQSGVAGDNPCTGGQTKNCDDNCPNAQNADQLDNNNDGVGDICDDPSGLIGDVNGSGTVGIEDAILAMQVMIGMNPAGVHLSADVNGDGKIGLPEAIYVLQSVVGLRTNPSAYKVAFTRNNKIWTMDITGNNLIQVTSAGYSSGANWFSNGSKIAFYSDEAGNYDIFVVNASGSNKIQLTENPKNEYNPVVSPNGSKVAYVHSESGVTYTYDNRLMVMDINGNNKIELINPRALDSGYDSVNRVLGWSDDSNYILFGTSGPTAYKYDIWKVNVNDTSDRVKLTDSSGTLGNCLDSSGNDAWKNNVIVYSSSRYSNYTNNDIYTMDTSGGNKQSILVTDYYLGQANWSKDGEKIVYISNETGNYEIWTMDPDGSNRVQVTQFNDGDVSAPDIY